MKEAGSLKIRWQSQRVFHLKFDLNCCSKQNWLTWRRIYQNQLSLRFAISSF
jgi:hypothetical protein